MISSSDFRTGVTIEIDGEVWQVIDFQHVKPGKGAAFVRTKMKNVRTGSVVERTFNPGEKIPKAHVDNRKMQYLYENDEMYVFMDNETYEQSELTKEQLGDALKYLKENMEAEFGYRTENDNTRNVDAAQKADGRGATAGTQRDGHGAELERAARNAGQAVPAADAVGHGPENASDESRSAGISDQDADERRKIRETGWEPEREVFFQLQGKGIKAAAGFEEFQPPFVTKGSLKLVGLVVIV